MTLSRTFRKLSIYCQINHQNRFDQNVTQLANVCCITRIGLPHLHLDDRKTSRSGEVKYQSGNRLGCGIVVHDEKRLTCVP